MKPSEWIDNRIAEIKKEVDENEISTGRSFSYLGAYLQTFKEFLDQKFPE